MREWGVHFRSEGDGGQHYEHHMTRTVKEDPGPNAGGLDLARE